MGCKLYIRVLLNKEYRDHNPRGIPFLPSQAQASVLRGGAWGPPRVATRQQGSVQAGSSGCGSLNGLHGAPRCSSSRGWKGISLAPERADAHALRRRPLPVPPPLTIVTGAVGPRPAPARSERVPGEALGGSAVGSGGAGLAGVGRAQNTPDRPSDRSADLHCVPARRTPHD